MDEAKASWAAGHESEAPEDVAACKQRAWDSIRTKSTSQRLLDNAADEEERARLLAVMMKESGAWLRALPVTALGLRMDDSTVDFPCVRTVRIACVQSVSLYEPSAVSALAQLPLNGSVTLI